jgi:tetratricopeptide (TPR) repeat protein
MKPLKTLDAGVTDGETSNQTSNSNSTSTTSPSTHTNTTTSTGSDPRIIQNFRLIWLDSSIDEVNNNDTINTITKLREVVNTVNKFTDADECIDFVTNIENEKAFFIVSGSSGQDLVPNIHDLPQVDAIYIFCGNPSRHEQWTKEWIKIKGVHNDIKPICQALQQAAKQCNQDSIAMSFVTVNEEASSGNLDQLEPSFMYTQIFKEILLEMEHDEKSIKDLAIYCRELFKNNMRELNIISEFEHKYRLKSPIWWYTRECFTYQMLNRALRTLEGDTIINMGFFIRDLHEQIQQLYQKQVSSYHGKSFTVYRGQGLLKTDFDKLMKTKNGLMSFNNFLSTSTKQEVSLGFAKNASKKTDMVGVLFKMTIDPSVSSAPFASIQDVSYYKTEEEILFSMHTVFRVGEINKLDNKDSLYQVDLTLTADDDQQLRTLTERIREEFEDETGWQRLGQLLVKLSQFDKAKELYNVLIEQTSDEGEKAIYYNNLGYIKDHQGDYEKAIEYHEKALEIYQKTLPPNHPLLATSYGNIGTVYRNMGDYTKAVSFLQKDIGIREKTLPPDDPSLATSYNNIGGVYDNMGEYSKALSFYEKALKIRQKNLPPNHPDFAQSYNNIGEVYRNMGEYSKALSFFEKALEIRQKTLPPNHPLLATSYNNIATVYMNMGEYSKALSFYEKDLEISQKTLPRNHPDLATSYNNIGGVYMNMGEYSKALSFYEKDLEISQKTLPPNHPSLATSYNNIATVYMNMGEYSKALSFYEKALEIKQKTLPPNHPSLATSYNNIGEVYRNMGEYSKALSFYEKALEIYQKTLPPNHPLLATSYNNIGEVYRNMGEYSKALSSHEKALEIRQKTLPPNHPDFAQSYNNIGMVYYNMEEYSKALAYFERTLDINKRSLPPNHPHTQITQESIEIVKKKL